MDEVSIALSVSLGCIFMIVLLLVCLLVSCVVLLLMFPLFLAQVSSFQTQGGVKRFQERFEDCEERFKVLTVQGVNVQRAETQRNLRQLANLDPTGGVCTK